jgi:hypothetical protein
MITVVLWLLDTVLVGLDSVVTGCVVLLFDHFGVEWMGFFRTRMGTASYLP